MKQPLLIDLTTDGHVHTSLCHHAVGGMEDYVRAAVARGLKRLIFLEHLEIGIKYFEVTWLTEADFEYYMAEGRRLRRQYAGVLDIGLGVEVGYNPERLQEIREFLGRYHWDRIGISYHFLEHEGRHLNLLSKQLPNIEALGRLGLDQVMQSYLRGLIQAVESLDGDVLCHLDAAMRHHPLIGQAEGWQELLPELLAAVAGKGMALEVNTSGYPLRGEPFPAAWIIAEAVRRNIPLVAASDAHRPEDVARSFARLAEMGHNLTV